MMRFIFWQNVISIHQSAFIKALSTTYDVTLVVEDTLDQQRRNEKWQVPSMGKAKVVIAPTDTEMSTMLEQADTQHVFSGIDAFPMVYKAFKQAVRLKVPISVFAEPYEWAGLKGFLRRMKYTWLFMRYGRHINHLFTTGNMGMRCYRKAGFPSSKLHQWGYFTEQADILEIDRQPVTKPTLIFIGKIDTRKNVLALIENAKQTRSLFERFIIIGTGPLEGELKKMIVDEPKISFLGAIPNAEISSYLVHSDLLVLPSLFDGWGAVVNEALAVGTRVLCSNRCGAEVLLDGIGRGGTFDLNADGDLSAKLTLWLERGPVSAEQRQEISQWAKEHISGYTASKYFCDVVASKESIAPWITPPHLIGIRILFVGRLDANKNILPILRNFDSYGEHIACFSIIGDGPLYSELQTLALNNPKIKVLGRLCNDDAKKAMQEHDYLILPSLYDGWGAVVNEALGVGTRVLCSEACGASVLLDGEMRGAAFSQYTACATINKWGTKGQLTHEQRKAISQWANRHISGTVAANYFCKTIEGEHITAPWLT